MGPGRTGEIIVKNDGVCGSYYTDGILYPKSSTKVGDITDGTSKTLIVGEIFFETRLWTKGGFSNSTQGCIYSCKNIEHPINSDPQAYCYDNCNSGIRTCEYNDSFMGSLHPGGANFLASDGSVHFLNENLDFIIYQDLCTRANGEVNDMSF